MDGLKLKKWRESFLSEAKKLLIEFDSFFTHNRLEEMYELKIDPDRQNLCLEIKTEDLPKEI